MQARILSCLSTLVLLVAPLFAVGAADRNGYTAQYECRAGNANCNVDVAALRTRACGQIITTSMPWSSIDWSSNTICLEAGDHSWKGTLTIPSSASGAGSNYKVLRYYRRDDSGDEAWNQTAANRAKVRRIAISGADYWSIHRLTLDGDGNRFGGLLDFLNDTGSNFNIADGLLIEDGNSNGVHVGAGNNGNTIQNSVIRNCRYNRGNDYSGVEHDGGPSNTRTVNNEIYGCNKGVYISEHVAAGTVIENNDIYVPTSMYTDCDGNYNGTGPCSATETQLGTKNGGTSSNPVKIIHNRIWGNRATDMTVCCNGGGQGSLVFIGGQGPNTDPNRVGAKYTLFQNNVLMDAQFGVGGYWSGVRNNSYIGNIIYKIRQFNSKYPSLGINSGSGHQSEWYLNTIIDAHVWDTPSGPYGGNDNDVRCNVVVNSGGASKPGSGTQIENNAFFGAPPITTASSSNDVVSANGSNSNNEEFCFYTKLLTGPERVCIPHALPTAASPHRGTCDATAELRRGIGISDSGLF